MKSKWIKISLFFFLIIAVIGTLLRSVSFIPIPLTFQNLVHAHSHTAFQGWIYTAQFILLTQLFLNKEQIQKGYYPLQFKITIAVIIGVLLSFSLQGYGLFSIVFSTLFQVLNFIFIYCFLKDTKNTSSSVAFRFVKTGLWLGVLSNFVPFGVGFLTVKGFKGTEMFNAFLYSFLHLQYNGWFFFTAVGLLFKILEKRSIDFSDAHKFYQFFAISVFPAITLSFLGMSFADYILIPAYISVVLQCVGIFYLVRFFYRNQITFNISKNQLFRLFFIVFLVSFLLKILVQSLSVLPVFNHLAFENKFIILAYLHLIFIGVLSSATLANITHLKWIKLTEWSKIATVFLLLGFLVTELLLVCGGLGLFYSEVGMFLGSSLMALGILLFFLTYKKR